MLVRFNSKKYAQLEDLSCFTFLFATVSDSLIVDFGWFWICLDMASVASRHWTSWGLKSWWLRKSNVSNSFTMTPMRCKQLLRLEVLSNITAPLYLKTVPARWKGFPKDELHKSPSLNSTFSKLPLPRVCTDYTFRAHILFSPNSRQSPFSSPWQKTERLKDWSCGSN